jgi:hypothetical protein
MGVGGAARSDVVSRHGAELGRQRLALGERPGHLRIEVFANVERHRGQPRSQLSASSIALPPRLSLAIHPARCGCYYRPAVAVSSRFDAAGALKRVTPAYLRPALRKPSIRRSTSSGSLKGGTLRQ